MNYSNKMPIKIKEQEPALILLVSLAVAVVIIFDVLFVWLPITAIVVPVVGYDPRILIMLSGLLMIAINFWITTIVAAPLARFIARVMGFKLKTRDQHDVSSRTE